MNRLPGAALLIVILVVIAGAQGTAAGHPGAQTQQTQPAAPPNRNQGPATQPPTTQTPPQSPPNAVSPPAATIDAQKPAVPGAQAVPPPAPRLPGTVPCPVPVPPATAPARSFTSETGIIFHQVQPTRVADFDKLIAYLREALENSKDPTVRKQAQGWKIYRAVESGPNGDVLYVFLFDPAVPCIDYALGPILAEAFPDPAQLQEIWKLYTTSVRTGGTVMTLAPVPVMPAPPILTPPTTTTPATTTPGKPQPGATPPSPTQKP